MQQRLYTRQYLRERLVPLGMVTTVVARTNMYGDSSELPFLKQQRRINHRKHVARDSESGKDTQHSDNMRRNYTTTAPPLPQQEPRTHFMSTTLYRTRIDTLILSPNPLTVQHRGTHQNTLALLTIMLLEVSFGLEQEAKLTVPHTENKLKDWLRTHH